MNRRSLRKKILFLAIALILGAATSCATKPKASDFVPTQFESPDYGLILCIDLSRDRTPVAGLIVNKRPNLSAGQHTVILPFASTESQFDSRLLNTWGSHTKFTLLTYLVSDKINSSNSVGVVPQIRTYKPEELPSDELARDPVYMIVSGQDRTLVFRYPVQGGGEQKLPAQMPNVIQDSLDSVAVKFPDNIKRVRGELLVDERPKRELERADYKIRYYPATSEKAQAPAIELSYFLEPNATQEMLVEYVIRAVGILLIPGITLFYIGKGDVKNPKRRKLLLWTLGILQAIIIIGVVIYYIFVSSITDSQMKAMLDTALSIIGGIVTQVVASMQVNKNHAKGAV
jgi:hypothetical protein